MASHIKHGKCKQMMVKKPYGFTLIELLVVMTVIAILLTLAVPRYMGNVDKANEAVLRENLSSIRDALDKYYGDSGAYPTTLEDLVTKKYLRKIPADPFVEGTNTWVIVAPTDPQKGGIADIHSAAPGKAKDGTSYSDW